MPATPFAAFGDLEGRWRPLDSSERSRADILLGVAARVIRSGYGDIDSRVAAGLVDPLTPVDVSCAMVRRAFEGAAARVRAAAVTVGNVRVENARVEVKDDDVYLTAHDRSLLNPTRAGAGGGVLPRGGFPPALGWPRS